MADIRTIIRMANRYDQIGRPDLADKMDRVAMGEFSPEDFLREEHLKGFDADNFQGIDNSEVFDDFNSYDFEREKYHSIYKPGDPRAPWETLTIPEDVIAEYMMEKIQETTGIYADTLDELIPKLIHTQYMDLKYGPDVWEDDFSEEDIEFSSIDAYDPDLLQEAVDDVQSGLIGLYQKAAEELSETWDTPSLPEDW